MISHRTPPSRHTRFTFPRETLHDVSWSMKHPSERVAPSRPIAGSACDHSWLAVLSTLRGAWHYEHPRSLAFVITTCICETYARWSGCDDGTEGVRWLRVYRYVMFESGPPGDGRLRMTVTPRSSRLSVLPIRARACSWTPLPSPWAERSRVS